MRMRESILGHRGPATRDGSELGQRQRRGRPGAEAAGEIQGQSRRRPEALTERRPGRWRPRGGGGEALWWTGLNTLQRSIG